MAFAKDMMRMYLDAPTDVGSPWFNPQTADLMQKHYGLPLDRMKEEKEQSNRFVMERLELIRQKVRSFFYFFQNIFSDLVRGLTVSFFLL